jgi:hypothetical protein
MSIDRLAAANPIPTAPALDDRALFDRIVALPQERRRRLRKRTAIVLAFAVAAIIASTTYGVSSWLVAVKPPVTIREYREAQQVLPLPPGATWPGYRFQAETVMSPGAGGSIAVSQAIGAWECYWGSAIRRDDAAAARRAHDELSTLLRDNVVIAPKDAPENYAPPYDPKHPLAVFADDGGYQYKERIYAEAAAGAPERLFESCAANG